VVDVGRTTEAQMAQDQQNQDVPRVEGSGSTSHPPRLRRGMTRAKVKGIVEGRESHIRGAASFDPRSFHSPDGWTLQSRDPGTAPPGRELPPGESSDRLRRTFEDIGVLLLGLVILVGFLLLLGAEGVPW
jgi:hypothetical protein